MAEPVETILLLWKVLKRITVFTDRRKVSVKLGQYNNCGPYIASSQCRYGRTVLFTVADAINASYQG